MLVSDHGFERVDGFCGPEDSLERRNDGDQHDGYYKRCGAPRQGWYRP